MINQPPHEDAGFRGRLVGFADYQFDQVLLELRRNGDVVHLQQQPVRLLAALLRRAGQLVTREELRSEIWPDVSYLEYDDALNHLVKSLRDTLGDSAVRPRFIETVPRRGYRFIAPAHEVTSTVAPSSLPAQTPAAPVSTPSRPIRSSVLFVGIASAAMMVLAVFLWTLGSARRLPRVTSATQLTHFGLASAVLAEGDRLFIQQQKGGIATIVTAPIDGSGDPVAFPTPFRNAALLDISPDRTALLVGGYEKSSDEHALWLIPLAGGSPRRFQNFVASSAKWSPDGSHLAFTGHPLGAEHGLYITDADGSNPRRVGIDIAFVNGWSPDSRVLRFTRVNGTTGGMSMWEMALDSSRVDPVAPSPRLAEARWGEGQCCGQWSRNGRYFIFREANDRDIALWATPVTGVSLQRPRPTKIYASPFDIDAYSLPALAPNGRRMYVVGRNESRALLRYNRARREFVPFLPGISAVFLAFSPDGRWIAYSRFPDLTLWRSRADGSERLQLTDGPAQAYGPTWSADSKYIAFHALSPGKPGKVTIVSADGGPAQVLFADESSTEDAQNWSPQGSRLLFGRVLLAKNGGTTSAGSWIFDQATGKVTQVPDSNSRASVMWSPDGNRFAALSDDARTLFVFDSRTNAWTQIATGDYFSRPYWSHDGSAIYFQDTHASEEQPIYRVVLATHKVELVAGRDNILQADLGRFRLLGLTPTDQPIISAVHTNADVYALDLDLP